MSVLAHGVDLIECRRIAEILERHGERFVERILTSRERVYVCSRRLPIPHLAGRFAAKEAILKALGTGWRGRVSWHDMEIINDSAGRPSVALTGESSRIAERLGIRRVLISITHTKDHAVASAIALGE